MRFSSMSWVMTLLDIVNRFRSAYNDSGVPHSDNFSAASIRGPFSPPGSVSRLTTLSICFDDGVEPRLRKSNINGGHKKAEKTQSVFVFFVLFCGYFPISTSVNGS